MASRHRGLLDDEPGTAAAMTGAVSRLGHLAPALALLATSTLWACVTARGRADQTFERADVAIVLDDGDRVEVFVGRWITPSSSSAPPPMTTTSTV
jgi:hypothetical protein